MLKILTLFLICCSLSTSFVPHHDFSPFLISVRKTKNIEKALNRLPYTLVSQTPEEIYIKVPFEEEIYVLEEQGYHVDRLYKNTPEWKYYMEFYNNGSYHNYEQLTKFLQDMKTKYGDIFDYFSIGKSVKGRELWV